jgi:hypothetical protein
MLNSSRMRTALLCLFIAISSSLFAADGVTIIDQRSAQAGNVTPGDAPGFPVTISRPGSYKLMSNLNVSHEDVTAILVTAPNVTINMNGFSIIGPTQCVDGGFALPTCPTLGVGIGVQAGDDVTAGPRNVKVLNGTIHGMSKHGILLTGDGSYVEKVSAELNTGTGLVVAGTVIDSSATSNGQSGVLALIVRETTAVTNVLDGIILDGRGGVGIGDFANFNGGRGFVPQNGSLIDSTATRNTGFGVAAICPSSIVNNTIVSNTGGSISTNDGTCVLANNATRP